jgi:NAD-dependent deacetylase
MATYAMFEKHPDEVWKWYLYRLSVCGNASPNKGHLALVEMEQHLHDRFTLITQNVDNLHLHAGSSPEPIHNDQPDTEPASKHVHWRVSNEELIQRC